ncbi:MAG: YncE family protein [Saprospiraceae bacterium]|nr:YncE family protein [Saprospiraceae bacterium]
MQRFPFWLIAFPLSLFALASCDKEDAPVPPVTAQFQPGKGVFVTNEGTFGAGNAEIGYYDFDQLAYAGGLFQQINGRPLGDVAQSMTLIGDEGFIVVNNASTIEIVDLSDLSSSGQMGFPSPRYLLPIDDQKAYVTDLSASAIFVVDLEAREASSTIPTQGWTEEMVRIGDEVFVSQRFTEWVYVIDTQSDQITDSIQLKIDPSALAVDQEQKLWVFCGTDYNTFEPGSLYRIDPASRQILKEYPFDDLDIGVWPRLKTTPAGDSLYVNMGDLLKMPIDAAELPAPWVEAGGRMFYGMEVDPMTGWVYVGDAIDFQQRGQVYIYRPDGSLVQSFQAGVSPNGFWFY